MGSRMDLGHHRQSRLPTGEVKAGGGHHTLTGALCGRGAGTARVAGGKQLELAVSLA
jgi:hypothetical protein